MALNGGPQFKFNESISFVINCETSQDIDYYWSKLTEGGQPRQCDWLKDKYGLSQQVVPTGLGEVLGDNDHARAKRAIEAMLDVEARP